MRVLLRDSPTPTVYMCHACKQNCLLLKRFIQFHISLPILCLLRRSVRRWTMMSGPVRACPPGRAPRTAPFWGTGPRTKFRCQSFYQQDCSWRSALQIQNIIRKVSEETKQNRNEHNCMFNASSTFATILDFTYFEQRNEWHLVWSTLKSSKYVGCECPV